MKLRRLKSKKTDERIAMLFCFLYPILPVYASVFGINGRNLLCFIILLLTILFTRNYKVKIYTPFSIVMIFAIWILGRFFQVMISKSIPEAIYFLFLTVVMYYCLSKLVRSVDDFLSCIKAVLYGGYFVSILGIFEEITHINLFSYMNREYELNYNPLRFGILRIIGFSQHTIVHGVYIMFCMSLCLYMWQFMKHLRKGKAFITVLYVLLSINLILTLSRSIIIITIISQLFILYLLGVRKFFRIIIKILLIGIPLLFLLSLIIPRVGDIIRAGVLMVAAIFDDRAAATISSAFGNDNLRGVGNRLDLYKWVLEKMPGRWLFGFGWNAEFSHSFTQSNGVYTWTQIKDSIEVQYLSTLYQYGLFGMITEILTFVSLLFVCMKRNMKKRTWEPIIGFNRIAFATFICYFLEMFAVNQSSDRYIFYLFAMLLLIYKKQNLEYGLLSKS